MCFDLKDFHPTSIRYNWGKWKWRLAGNNTVKLSILMQVRGQGNTSCLVNCWNHRLDPKEEFEECTVNLIWVGRHLKCHLVPVSLLWMGTLSRLLKAPSSSPSFWLVCFVLPWTTSSVEIEWAESLSFGKNCSKYLRLQWDGKAEANLYLALWYENSWCKSKTSY